MLRNFLTCYQINLNDVHPIEIYVPFSLLL